MQKQNMKKVDIKELWVNMDVGQYMTMGNGW